MNIVHIAKCFKKIGGCALALALLMSMCFVPAGEASAAEKSAVILQIPMPDDPYYGALLKALEKDAQAKGWDLSVLANELDPYMEAANLETAIQMKPDLIINVSLSSETGDAMVKKIFDAGIPLINMGKRCATKNEKYVTAFSGYDDYAFGRAMAKVMHKALNGKGNVVIMTVPFIPELEQREKGFRDGLKALKSRIKILKTAHSKYGEYEAQLAMEDVICVVYKPMFDGVFATSDELALGAAQALYNAKLDDRAVVCSVGGGKSGLQAVKDGSLYATAMALPSRLMTNTAALAEKILKSGKPKRLKPFLNYTQPIIVTKDNVDEYLPGEW